MKEFIAYLTLGASAGLLSLAPSQPGSPASPAAEETQSRASVVAPFPPVPVAHDALPVNGPEPAVVTPNADNASVVPVQAVTWHENFETARAEAVRQNKRLLVRFTAPWCAPCARHAALDSNEDRRVVLNSYVLLKVNVDKQPFWRLRGVRIERAKGIPYEAIYESDMTPVWAGNPTRVRDYIPILRRFGMRSVLKPVYANKLPYVGRSDDGFTAYDGTGFDLDSGGCINKKCKCDPCYCGPNCACGTVLQGRPDNPACRCIDCQCGENCGCT